MPNPKDAVVKVSPSLAIRPDFIPANDVKIGKQEMAEYVILPRMKVMQPQSDSELLNQFPAGDIIAVPINMAVLSPPRNKGGQIDFNAQDGLSFFVTPVFFWPEWWKTNSNDLRGVEPFIVQRTLDKNDPLVAKCKNRDLWEEQHPQYPNDRNKNRRNIEVLNFACVVWNEKTNIDLSNILVMSFAKGEYIAGSRWSTLCTMRDAPYFAGVFQVKLARRSNAKGNWFGVDVTNPPENVSPWVDETEYEPLKQLHIHLQKLHNARNLGVADMDDVGSESDNANVTSDM